MARGYGDLGIKGLSRQSDIWNTVKWGLKVFGGVALFRDPPLPVPLDALFMAHVLETKSERLYNGVMLKISPTKGHKE